MPQQVQPSPAGQSVDLGRPGQQVLVAIVVLGLAATVAMNEAPLRASENLGIGALGIVFLVLMLAASRGIEHRGPVLQAAYFAAQLVLATGIFALQARLGSFGMAWLLLLPLLVQGMFVWRRAGMAALTGLVFLMPVLHVAALAGARAAVEVAIGVGAGIGFVLLFSAATVREARARSESDRLGAELAAANRRLAELAVGAEELATSRERNRLAREIHDSVGHSLTVASVQLEAAGALLERDRQQSLRALANASDAVRGGLAELRRSVAALRSGPLVERSLAEALEELCTEARASGLAASLQLAGTPRSLAADAALALYRVAQEGLTNVRKHAAAATVEVALEYGPAGVVLSLVDDGRGGEVDAEAGFGLLGLRERLALLGGTLAASSRTTGGFELRAEVPR